jgi:hypothetical protein
MKQKQDAMMKGMAKSLLEREKSDHQMDVESTRNLALLNLTLPPNMVAPGIPVVRVGLIYVL